VATVVATVVERRDEEVLLVLLLRATVGVFATVVP